MTEIQWIRSPVWRNWFLNFKTVEISSLHHQNPNKLSHKLKFYSLSPTKTKLHFPLNNFNAMIRNAAINCCCKQNSLAITFGIIEINSVSTSWHYLRNCKLLHGNVISSCIYEPRVWTRMIKIRIFYYSGFQVRHDIWEAFTIGPVTQIVPIFCGDLLISMVFVVHDPMNPQSINWVT